MKTKRNALTRIIVFSVLIIVLLSILLLGIRKGSFPIPVLHLGSSGQYENANEYKSGDASLTADRLDQLEINWVDGKVSVSPYEGKTIEIKENASGNLSDREQLHYYFKEGKLIIQYRESGLFSWGGNNKNKNLTVQIPTALCQNLSEVSIDATSCDVDVTGLSGKNFDFDTVSGNIQATDVDCTQKFNLDTVSGEFKFTGKIQELDVDTTSGECNVSSDITPNKIDFDGVSGGLVLQIPASSQFTLDFDSVSGDFNNNFSTVQNGDTYTCGNGSAQYDVESVSGDVEIRKK
ncbi:MAG: DUF4097 family beta strand repeat protein [Eubacterium sp.]|nr:DUF4097 family beta strand repeat protein [Eubacterium sp.]